jgi:Protein of unknown function (DUF2971)
MAAFTRDKNFKSCVALCFTGAAETYHHWKIFSPGDSGVCIEFNKDALLSSFDESFCHRKVQYTKLSELFDTSAKHGDKAFMKRVAFKDEKEYRVVYGDLKKTNAAPKAVPINFRCIERIILNPWIPKSLFDQVCATIRLIPGCEVIAVSRSLLIDSPAWQTFAEENSY